MSSRLRCCGRPKEAPGPGRRRAETRGRSGPGARAHCGGGSGRRATNRRGMHEGFSHRPATDTQVIAHHTGNAPEPAKSRNGPKGGEKEGQGRISGRITRLGHINFNTPPATGGSPTIFTSRPAPTTSVRTALAMATHPPGVL